MDKTPAHPSSDATGHEVIETALSRAIKADPNDAPFPLDHEQAALWHQAQASAYQHALEMIPAAREIAAQGVEGEPPVAQVRCSSEGPHGTLYAGLIPAGPRTPKVKEGDLLYLHPPHVADALDGERLIRLARWLREQMKHCEGGLEGSWMRWQWDTYRNVLDQIGATAIAARAEEGGKP